MAAVRSSLVRASARPARRIKAQLTWQVNPEAKPILTRLDVPGLRRLVHRMLLAAARKEGSSLEAGVLLTGDVEMQELNRRFRNKNKTTDVLAFAHRESLAGKYMTGQLGDIVISVAKAKVQAKRGLSYEIGFLAAHGLCHLLGYDHQNDDDEESMNERMKQLLRAARAQGPVRPA